MEAGLNHKSKKKKIN